ANYVTSIAAAGPTDNVRLTVSDAVAAGTLNKVINSLILVGNSILGLAAGTAQNHARLTIASGGVLSTGGATASIIGNAYGDLDFGSSEALISGNNLILNANVLGSGGLTSFGAGTVTINTRNDYSGTT